MAKWFVSAKKADFNRIGEKYNISPVLARIIRNRDVIEDYEIEKFAERAAFTILAAGREDGSLAKELNLIAKIALA